MVDRDTGCESSVPLAVGLATVLARVPQRRGRRRPGGATIALVARLLAGISQNSDLKGDRDDDRCMVEPTGTILPFVAGLTVLLVVAHALGAGADRLGFAPVVGELLTGLVVGPSLLGAAIPGLAALFVPLPAPLSSFATLGLLFLVVLAGTEVEMGALGREARGVLAVAAGGSLVPFAAGFAFGWFLPAAALPAGANRTVVSLFLATALSISALPVAVRVLVDLDALHRRVGQVTLAAAVAIDVFGWIALSVVADVARVGRVHPTVVARSLLLLVGFAVVVLAVGRPLVGRVLDRAAGTRSPALSSFSVVVVVALGVGTAALAVGLELVVGGFLAGLIVAPSLDGAASRAFQMATLGLFAPIFFATAGIQVDLAALLAPGAVGLLLGAFAVAVVGKVAGVLLGAVATDFSWPERWALAVGLNARGALEIVVAAVGLAIGVLTPALYAAVVVVAVATSVMTPPLLRRALARVPEA